MSCNFIIKKLSLIYTLLIIAPLILPGISQGEEEEKPVTIAPLIIQGMSQGEEDEKPVTENITVIGTYTADKEDADKAKEDAIAKCLISAVDQAALKLFSAEFMTENFQKFNKIILGHTDDFIQTYKLLSDYESENRYRIMIEATVLINKLKEQLAVTEESKVEKKVLPKVLLLIAEQNIQDILPQYWWGVTPPTAEFVSEGVIVNILKEKGFTVVEHGTGIPNIDKAESTVIYKSYPDGYEAVEIGVRFQADVVIVGKAIAQQSLNIIGEEAKTYTGTVTVRAFRTDTGEEITSSSKTEVKTSTDENEGARESLLAAGTLVGNELASQIAYTWQEKVKESEGITLIVTGISKLGNFVMFRKILKEMPNVKEIQVTEMKANEAVINIEADTDAKKLAEALMLKTFESFSINISEITDNRLKIELVSK